MELIPKEAYLNLMTMYKSLPPHSPTKTVILFSWPNLSCSDISASKGK